MRQLYSPRYSSLAEREVLKIHFFLSWFLLQQTAQTKSTVRRLGKDEWESVWNKSVVQAVSLNLLGGSDKINEKTWIRCSGLDTNLITPAHKSKTTPLHPPKLRLLVAMHLFLLTTFRHTQVFYLILKSVKPQKLPEIIVPCSGIVYTVFLKRDTIRWCKKI